ncbi:MAG: proprotein convertase P-domain-containing protein [Deltaproteobacteria bacterium]|nr:proprotein convertase P-domain-containing protein [Deltaproteobacteria bacterium]
MRWLPLALLVGVALAPCATPVHAVPQTVTVQGALSASGGPVADGAYVLQVSIYKDATAPTPLWTEGPLLAVTKGGQFAVTLGDKAALAAEVVAQMGATPFIGVKVEPDPELARVALRSVPFALRAGVAESVDCSGCVGAKALDPAALAPFAKAGDLAAVAKSGAFADLKDAPDLASYAKAADLHKVAKSGAYGDLAGVPDLDQFVKAASLAKVAGSGEYADLKGAPDLNLYAKTAKLADVALTGKYLDLQGLPVLAKVGASCGTGLVLKGFKADGSFDCVPGFDPSALPKDALDEVSNGLLTNQFTEVIASAKTPIDLLDAAPAGVSDAIDVPDLGLIQGVKVYAKIANSGISKVRVLLYDPNGAEYVLYDQGSTGSTLEGTWPKPNALVKGDLSGWAGKSPKGIWALKVADLEGTAGGKDGKLLAWSVGFDVVSAQKVGAKGALVLGQFSDAPVPCSVANAGAMWFNTKDSTVQICNGVQYFPLSLAYWGTQTNPALTCKDLLAKLPSTQSGLYWIDPDGLGGVAPFQVQCDMTTSGGGWTRVDETTDFAYKIYTESAAEQPYKYNLTDAQIDAVKAKSTEGRQAWQCHTVGVGNAYNLRWWPKQTTATYAGCWATNNADEKSASGTETSFSNLPQRSWFSEDCGDNGEACQHNVDHAWFR